MTHRSGLLALAIVTLLIPTGCIDLFSLLGGPGGGPSQFVTGNTRLQRFESPEQLLAFFKEQAERNVRTNRFFSPFAPFAADDLATAEDAGGATNGAAGDGDSAAPDFTSTNLQESDVDEADVFKSDGEYFYIVRDRMLEIVDVRDPANPAALASLQVADNVADMYLRGNRLILLTRLFVDFDWGWEVADALIYPPYYGGSTLVLYDIDISDRSNPVVTERVEMDGNLVSSRLTGDVLVLILSIVPDLPNTMAEIRTLELDDILPDFVTDAGTTDLVVWSDYFYPGRPDGTFMTAVVALDADDLTTERSSTAIVGNASTIYSSSSALYVSDADYDPNDNYRETTTLHKFAYTDAGAAEYVATGSVPGRLLNQYSLGEYQDNLNLATYIPPNFNFGDFDIAVPGFGVAVAEPAVRQSLDETVGRNAVFTLGDDGEGTLDVLGSIDGIAPNERLYSARFMGERGFLVTFRQIDPFFTVDLSEADNPQIRGELKIPGFSDYLHPYGENYVIGVGRAVEINQFGGAVPTGMQLSLFDVSDFDNPTLVEQIQVGSNGSMADASYQPKAFAFLPSSGLLALPAQIYTGGFNGVFENGVSQGYFDGVLTYRVSETGFEAVAEIPNVVRNEFGFGYRTWSRAAFIGDQVFAVTAYGVSSADINAPETVATVELE